MARVKLTRTESLRLGHQATDTTIPFEQFKNALSDWHIKPVIKNGNVVGIFFHKNSEIHFSILPEYRGKWFSKKIVKEFLLPIFKQYGYLTTKVSETKSFGHKVVKKFGFEFVSKDGFVTTYKLSSLRFI